MKACDKLFLAKSKKFDLCSEACRTQKRQKARQAFADKTKSLPYEQADEREYMFWYNRIAKLKRSNAPQETQDRASAALKQFQAEAVK